MSNSRREDSNLAHTLKTPLNAMLGYAQILSDQIEDPALKQHADSIRTSGQQLLKLINEHFSTNASTDSVSIAKKLATVTFKPATIVVADDLKANRDVLMLMMRNQPFKFIEVEDGNELLAVVEREKVDLILTDLGMPVMGGLAAANKIRAKKGADALPILAVTAFDDAGEKEDLSAFNAVINKPVEATKLLSVLGDYLGAEKSGGELITEFQSDDLESIVKLEELCEYLSSYEEGSWKEVSKLLRSDLIEQFADSLLGLGSAHEAEALVAYAKELKNQNKVFAIDNVSTLLEQFPQLVASYKNSERL